MKRFIETLFLCGLGLFLVSCAGSQREPDRAVSSLPVNDDRVIARVNQEPITYGEWLTAYNNQSGRRPMSEEDFLDQYINYKLGEQRASVMHLEGHPLVQYELNKFIYNSYVSEKYRSSRSKLGKKEWEERLLSVLRGKSQVWISPAYLSGHLNELDGDTVIARVDKGEITAEDFRRLYRRYSQRDYHHREFLEDLVYFEIVVSQAKMEGWEARPETIVARSRILFQMANHVQLGRNYLDPKSVKKLYEKERARADVEVYSIR